jgi:uncharacterized membrane protein
MRKSKRHLQNRTPSPGQQPTRVAQRTITAQVTAASWSGPLPAPADLQRFNEIIPDGASRIMALAEKQADHRIAYERRALFIEGAERLGSRSLAFIFAVVALGVAGYCATINQPWIAGILGGGTIASVVAALVYTTKK